MPGTSSLMRPVAITLLTAAALTSAVPVLAGPTRQSSPVPEAPAVAVIDDTRHACVTAASYQVVDMNDEPMPSYDPAPQDGVVRGAPGLSVRVSYPGARTAGLPATTATNEGVPWEHAWGIDGLKPSLPFRYATCSAKAGDEPYIVTVRLPLNSAFTFTFGGSFKTGPFAGVRTGTLTAVEVDRIPTSTPARIAPSGTVGPGGGSGTGEGWYQDPRFWGVAGGAVLLLIVTGAFIKSRAATAPAATHVADAPPLATGMAPDVGTPGRVATHDDAFSELGRAVAEPVKEVASWGMPVWLERLLGRRHRS